MAVSTLKIKGENSASTDANGNLVDKVSGIVTKLIFLGSKKDPESKYVIFTLTKEDGKSLICKGDFEGIALNAEVSLEGYLKQETYSGARGKKTQETLIISKHDMNIHQSSDIFSKFLASVVPNLGIRRSRKIVDYTHNEFPSRSFDVQHALNCSPEDAAKWFNAIEEVKINEGIYTMLSEWGFSSKKSRDIVDELGKEALELHKNPYILIKVDGIGFKKADDLARKIFNIDSEDPERLKAGIEFSLQDAASRYGHTCGPAKTVLDKTDRILGVKGAAKTAFLNAVQERKIILYPDAGGKYGRICGLKKFDDAERYIAKDVAARLTGGLNVPDAIKKRFFSDLKPSQLAAAEDCFKSKFSILTGGPGVGKTWTASSIVKAAEAMGFSCALAAPTGKAAKKLSQFTGRDASTIHRLLGSRGELNSFEYDDKNKLPYDFILIDELSMCDIEMVSSLLKAAKSNAHVLFIGDPDQLQSIKAGSVLRDLIREKRIPVHRLREILRVDDGSLGIIHGSRKIIRGIMPDSGEGLNCKPVFTGRAAFDASIASIKKYIKMSSNPINDIQYLTAMHKGEVGIINMNRVIRGIILDSMGIDVNQANFTPIKYAGEIMNFVKGDRVIQTNKNHADINLYNGDVGVILETSKRGMVLDVDGEEIEVSGEKLYNIQPPYALSFHKSQGSGYKYVTMPVVNSQSIMLSPNLIYTGVTRTETEIDMIYQKPAMEKALDLKNAVPRFTHLPDMLTEEIDMAENAISNGIRSNSRLGTPSR